MLYVMSFIESLLLTWIRRLYSSSGKWQEILKTFFDVNILANCGTEYILNCQRNIMNPFWNDVFSAWKNI